MSSQVKDQQVVVYWITGCANCTRLKGYLSDRGVDYVAVDVQNDAAAFDDMQKAGIKTFPSVRVGERWATGLDLEQVDELVGLTRDPSGRQLAIEELVDRATRFLELDCRLAGQIPAEHWDDPTPTMSPFNAPVLFMADGSPYVPHHTYKLLVHHIAGHGEKFKRLALAADGVHEIGFGNEVITGEDAAFGEPDEGTPMYRVANQMDLTAKDLRAWLLVAGDYDLSRIVQTHYGPRTIHQLLQTAVVSLAQHSRQLIQLITERLGLAAEGHIPDSQFDGLLMPTTIWGD
jgi:glutaredoxin